MTTQVGQWRKSSYSDESGTNCVEVAASSVRDSKNPTGPVLVFPVARWKSFLTHVKNN
ncbi:DUF397 domain-containing protein [Umezawaea tangerina]|uniref:Uncharacterized protein DUF397 n=1 Tax=Umezawaea tangerina TaxID=84725 RepID=A0A2T0SY29_9PSEU|nr:DUF397 domain-containing protein [Umezawaea tangerina]PRY38263.1 uncharacterized protein DUF397 [Umezawaea tangerina]